MSWNEIYYYHFARFLKNPVDRYVFKQNEGGLPLYISVYDKVFKDCRIFCSIGLSHYEKEIGKNAEIFCPVDDEWLAVPEILANALFYMAGKSIPLNQGTAISLRIINPSFSEMYAKTAIYFTNPYGLPQDFERVEREGEYGEVYLVFFITEGEAVFLQTHGVTQFEKLLESRNVDPFHLKRETCI